MPILTHYKKDPLYTIWCGMKERCNNKNYPDYHNYGGRGIKHSSEWSFFLNFKEDMQEGYKKGLQLERVNNNGNYTKENCRWATSKEQQNNRRNNHVIEYKGIRDTLTHWAEFFNLKNSTLKMRINEYGWSFEKAINTPVRKRTKWQEV